MNKKIPLILIPIIAVITLSAIFYFGVEPELESIKIGVTLTETGPGSGIGLQVRDGLLMAVSEINSYDGINGRPLELIIVDNQNDVEKAKKDFLEMEETHAPLMFISSLSSISNAVSPLAEEHKVVLMALSATATNVTFEKEWTYRYFPTSEVEAITISRMLDGLNIYNLGVLYIDDDFGKSVADDIEIASKHPDRTIIREPFDLSVIDFKEHIMNLQDTEAIAIVTFPEYTRQILNDIREVNYPGYVIGSSDFIIPNMENIPEADGVYLATPPTFDPNFLYSIKIAENYESIYNKSFDHNAANGYDFVKMLDVLLEDEELTRNNVKQVLDGGFSHLGVFGNIRVSPGEHDLSFPLYPAQIHDGELDFKK